MVLSGLHLKTFSNTRFPYLSVLVSVSPLSPQSWRVFGIGATTHKRRRGCTRSIFSGFVVISALSSGSAPCFWQSRPKTSDILSRSTHTWLPRLSLTMRQTSWLTMPMPRRMPLLVSEHPQISVDQTGILYSRVFEQCISLPMLVFVSFSLDFSLRNSCYWQIIFLSLLWAQTAWVSTSRQMQSILRAWFLIRLGQREFLSRSNWRVFLFLHLRLAWG